MVGLACFVVSFFLFFFLAWIFWSDKTDRHVEIKLIPIVNSRKKRDITTQEFLKESIMFVCLYSSNFYLIPLALPRLQNHFLFLVPC